MKFFRKILFPFALLYGFITSFRNYLYTKKVLKAAKFNTPTIVVGNLSVGGTGKTPQIEYLIRLLQNNYKVAVLSRGYKRNSKGFIIANSGVNAEIIGDEPFQYYQKFPNIIVSVDANRTNGITKLEKLENPPDIILLDDAFQHRKVESDCNILLTSYNNLYIDDAMLPTGNLRENKAGAKRAQVVIVTKCPNNLSESAQKNIEKKLKLGKNQLLFFTTIAYDTNLKGSNEIELSKLIDTEILLITGIANPTPLVEYLKANKLKFYHMNFPDHYNFKPKDIAQIQDKFNNLKGNKKLILTTEKDYVRIFDKLENSYFISIKTTFINRENDFNKRINNYVEQSTRHR
jgi:tetraacyldisaccharide 4'-kinase